jgi:hypothetical protein
MAFELWTYRVQLAGLDLTGYAVEATDGPIGKIDDATSEADSSYVVVDTGPWIFGKKVMIPAGAVEDIALENKVVRVGLTKDQIKSSPGWDAETFGQQAYRDQLGSYYGGMDWGTEDRRQAI